MMNSYRAIILLLIVNLVNASFLNDTNTVDISYNTTNIFNGGGSFVSPELTLTINNNHDSGYDIDFKSSNGSKFVLEEGGSPVANPNDGEALDYEFDCDNYTVGVDTIVALGPLVLSPADTDKVMFNVPDPDAASSNKQVNCRFHLATGEDTDEIFDGTFSDTVTVTISVLP